MMTKFPTWLIFLASPHKIETSGMRYFPLPTSPSSSTATTTTTTLPPSSTAATAKRLCASALSSFWSPPTHHHHPHSRTFARRRRTLVLVTLITVVLLWWIAMSWAQPDPCATVEVTNPVILPSNARLPKIIHQQWKDEKLPPLFKTMREKVKRVFPESEGFRHILWTDATAAQMIRANYPEWYEAYESLAKNISKADAARCFILHKYGGMYLDADYEPLENFWNRLPDDGAAFIESPWTKWPYAGETHQNSLMSSPPGDEIWKLTFNLIFAHSNSSPTSPSRKKPSETPRHETSNREILGIAGPKMIDAALKLYKGKAYSLSCNNWHRMVYPTYKQWYRKIEHGFAFVTFGTKMCGWPNAGCHFGIHHGAASWN